MIVTLVAALSLAASLAIDVPYLPQTDALCGGAAAAMVFRYWGDAHADTREFAAFVDRRAGGIADDILIEAVRRRGWRPLTLGGGFAGLKRRLADRQPVIVLLADRGARYHYVVVIGETDEGVSIHDPSWGPSRQIGKAEFERLWRAANDWGLVILPPAGAITVPSVGQVAPDSPLSTDIRCNTLLSDALVEIRRDGFDRADAILRPIRTQCPAFAGPWRELAGVRFAQRRWKDAAALAREALVRDPRDAYASEVLGSSLFMQDDAVGALRAWNRIDKPRVNLVRIEGIRHTRYQAVAEALAIQPNTLLTAETFEHARRRLEELPDRTTARLALRPEADGYASVDVVVAERGGVPRSTAEWTATGARAAVTRSMDVSVPGTTGEGEVWSARWGFWPNRPSVGMAFATPRAGALPGVWRVDASWDAQTYAASGIGTPAPLRESRLHGGLTMSDWLTGRIRYSMSAGFDAWNGDRKGAAIGGAIERRWFANRAALEIHATNWIAVGPSPGFHTAGARLRLQSSPDLRGWVTLGTAGTDRVSDRAPFGVWPGAGEGEARAPLLRAHPLLEDGVIALGSSSAFGRSLSYGSVEAQRWFDRPLLARVGLAGFVDIARAARRANVDESPAHLDVGAGLRLRIPGTAGVLRADLAHGVRDGANALTLGWQF
jgi:peptidase C39-like protein